MNEDKSDAHSSLKLFSTEEAKEFLDVTLKTYLLDVHNKHQRSAAEFTTLV